MGRPHQVIDVVDHRCRPRYLQKKPRASLCVLGARNVSTSAKSSEDKG